MEAARTPNQRSTPLVGPRFTSQVRAGARVRAGRVLRVPVVVVGKLLVILGIAAVIAAMVILPIILMNEEEPEQGDWVFLAVLGGGGLAAIVIGRSSVHGRRHLVLFLRKFGYRDASAVASYAAERAMGRNWRLATLDDDNATSPIGVSPGLRRRANLVGILGLLLLLGSALAITLWIAGGGPDDLYQGWYDDAMREFEEENPDAGFGDSFGQAVGTSLGLGFALAFLAILAIVALLVVYTACVNAWMTRIAVKRADRAKTWLMLDPRSVNAVSETIAKRANRVHAPRLFIVRSSDDVWKTAVRSLVARADVVMIDISRPTENLLWEIRELARQERAKWVLVCAADSVTALRQHPDDPQQRALIALLDGEEVLLYGTGPAEVEEFARSLRNMFDRAARRHR